MRGVIAWFASNGVAANILMVFIIIVGLLTLGGIKQEVFPEVTPDAITIAVLYPGAAPAEVEEAVVIRIEERIQDLDDIKKISSVSAENVGTVIIELEDGANVSETLNEVKARVDAIDTFPDEAEKPVIEEFIVRRQVINVAIAGDADERTLKTIGERVRDDLAAQPEISQVELVSARPYEVSIEVSEQGLRRWGLTFDQVARAVRSSSFDLPGGSIETAGGEILLRTVGQAYSGREFEELPLLVLPDGTRLTLGDVARIDDGFAETDNAARFDGKPAVMVQVFRVGDQSAIEISNVVRDYIGTMQARLPEGIQLVPWQDDTLVLRGRIDLLLRNGRAGLVLVFLVLALFLRLKLAGWVALGIPISFLGAIAMMPTVDVSINVLSLFAFIVVLGIVVDDAIVVGENVYSNFQIGNTGLKGAVDGAHEVATPVIFAVLTSVAAFAPLLAVEGILGKIMRVIPLIVIPTLVFSLIESLLILPNHLSHVHLEKETTASWRHAWQRVQDRFARFLNWLIERTYKPSLDFAVEWRYLTLASGAAILFITFSMVAGGWIRFSFLPSVEADNVAALLTLPEGTPAEVTAARLRQIDQAAYDLEEELEAEYGQEIFRHILTSIGEQPFAQNQSRGMGDLGESFSASNLGEVNIELVGAEEREITSTQIAELWRERAGAVPEAVELTYSSSLFSAGNPIDVELAGVDVDELSRAAVELKETLREYPGVQDITDSYRAGKQELVLSISPEGEAAGLTLADLARQVRQAFYGEEAQRIQRGRDELKVMVRLPEVDRRSLGNLESLRIRTPDGAEIPFTTAAEVELTRGPATIRRTDRQRVVNVMADVDLAEGDTTTILADLEGRVLPDLTLRYPGVRYSFVGEQQEQRDSLGGLRRGFLLALVVIYGLLAIPFRSYMQPLIVMSAIPFGLIGAAWGHVLMGKSLTILSIFGLVALTGVVVNDSLVLVDFINRSYRSGIPLRQAIRDAGAARFRPILLTSLTTFAGLTPLLLERSLQAQFLIPMAISLAFGVLFSTFIILLMVPALYNILEDIRSALTGSVDEPEALQELDDAEFAG
jgi:multidrug efflux pump subunit AcrB